MQHRGGEGRDRSILAVRVGVGSEQRHTSTMPPEAVMARPGRRTSTSGARRTSAVLGSVGWAARVTSGASTTSTSVRGKTRQSGIRVRDGTDGVAAARRCGGEEGAKGTRRFSLFF